MQFIHDKKRNLYLYKTDKDLKGARRVGEYLAVPVSLNNIRTLREKGFPVASPLTGYDFPGDYRIIKEQRTMTEFLLMYPRSFNLSDPRTGKTVSTLWAIDNVLRDYEAKGVSASALILSTKSTLYDPWLRHAVKTFYGARPSIVLTGNAKQRYSMFRTPANIYIANYDALKMIVADELPDNIKVIVVDEFTAYKHANTKRFKHAEKIFDQVPYLWMLSGTPAPERSTDAYGPARLVHKLRGESYDSFKNRCMYKIGMFQWVERTEATDIAVTALKPSIRFTREQVIGLPNKLPIRVVDVELSSIQSKVIEELKERTIEEFNGKNVTIINAAGVRSKFMQAYQGVLYDDDKYAHDLEAKPRLEVLRELVAECNGRALIFTGFTAVVKKLLDALQYCNPRYITGAVTAKQRRVIVDEFNANKCGPIIGDPGTMSHGLDLTGGNTIIWYGPIDRNEYYQQANERIEGVNQKLPTQVVHIVASRLEREIFRRLEDKQSVQMSILEMLQ